MGLKKDLQELENHAQDAAHNANKFLFLNARENVIPELGSPLPRIASPIAGLDL